MTAVLSLGSNLGDRRSRLAAALDLLEPTAVSPLYETAPVGPVAQPDFLILVCLAGYGAAEAWERARRAEDSRALFVGVPIPCVVPCALGSTVPGLE